MKQKCILVVAVLAATALLFTACNKKASDGKYEETQFKMDTVMTITAYGSGAQEAVQESFKKIDEIEQLTSTTIATSDVSKINDAAGKGYVTVHPEVMKIIKESIKYSKLSNGAFDITVGPLIQLWGIGTKDARVPSPEEIKAKLPLVGYDKIKIDDANNSVMLEKPGMMIDLGGIAKGYTADEVQNILKNRGIKKGVINLGGSSVSVIGEKAKDTPWKIGIQHPRKENGGGYLGIISESDKSVSTSGDYERFFEKNGKRYHHILNPLTGYPADSGLMSSTIITDNSMDADVLSTVLFVLGPEKGIKFIEDTPGLECVVATTDRRVLTSSGMEGKVDSISGDFKYDAQGR